MRRNFLILLILFFVAVSVRSQSIDDVIVPRKTEIFMVLERTVSTKTAKTGDKFYGQVSVPVTANDKIIIPVGSYIIGHVDSSEKPGYVKGKAEILLLFDTIILPDGTTRKMQAVVHSAEGYESRPEEEQGRIEAPGSQGKEVAGTAAGGAITGATIGTAIGVGRGSTLKGLGVGTAIGAASGALIGVFQKGKDVVLPKGTSITIQLHDDIQFVKPEPAPTGTPMRP